MASNLLVFLSLALCVPTADATREESALHNERMLLVASDGAARARDSSRRHFGKILGKANEIQNHVVIDDTSTNSSSSPFPGQNFPQNDFSHFPQQTFPQHNFPQHSPHDFSYDNFQQRKGNALIGMAVLPFLFMVLMCGCPCMCVLVGHCRATRLREKLETLKFNYPAESTARLPPMQLSDGMQRLAQEKRLLLRQKINALQEISGAVAGFSVQTANFFEVLSASDEAASAKVATDAEGGEVLLMCRESEDVQAMLMRNAGGIMNALSRDGDSAANALQARSQVPFKMNVNLTHAAKQQQMQVLVPEGCVPGQMLAVCAGPGSAPFQVQVPPGAAPGTAFLVQLPTGPQQAIMPPAEGLQQIMGQMLPGSVPTPTDEAPFLYLDRPFRFECCCICRPHVEVFDMRGGSKVLLGIISDPFAVLDMTFNIYAGPDAKPEGVPSLSVKGAGCQPGTCTCCGLCCGRKCQEVYLEVMDPSRNNHTVAFITKGWAGAMKELVTSANSFFIDFGEVENPTYKALLLATTIFINYRFFEGASGSRNKPGQHDG